MAITVQAGPPSPDAFASYGTFVDRPARRGERRDYGDWLSPVRGLTLRVHTNRVAPAALPLTVTRVERHPHAAQMFVPLVTSRYLVVVMPSLVNGDPDAAAACAFTVPATLGVAYRPNVWHAGITALGDEASFAVLMWRGAPDDDVFADVDPIVVSDWDGRA